MKPAVFLDRDGTINEDVGNLFRVNDIVFIPGSIEALKKLQEHYLIFIITNQSGIGRGEFSFEEYLKFETEYTSILSENGVIITETKCCPHTPEYGCSCRKPSTQFIDELSANYGLDLAASFSVGDHLHDPEMGSKSGGRGIYLLTGHGRKHYRMIEESSYKPDFIANDLMEAAGIILGL